MKKIILLLALTLGFAFSAFAQENKTLTVEIRKNGELVSKYQTLFTGLPGEAKRTSLVSYVKEVNPIESGPLKGMYETVLGEVEHGTMISYDKDTIHAVVYDAFKMDVIKMGDATVQKPEYNVYKVDFPAKLTKSPVQVAQVNGITVSYSLE